MTTVFPWIKQIKGEMAVLSMVTESQVTSAMLEYWEGKMTVMLADVGTSY